MVILASMNTNLAQNALLGLSMEKGEIPIILFHHPIKKYATHNLILSPNKEVCYLIGKVPTKTV